MRRHRLPRKFEGLRDKIVPALLPYGVRRVAVFGSTVRGESGPESDLDILVDLKPPDQRAPIGLKWFALERELSRLVGRKVDLVTEGDLSPYIRPHAEKEMVILYEEG